MNKRDAKHAAWNNDYTAGSLRKMIESNRGKGGMSAVNKSLSKEKALDILEEGIEGISDNEIVNPEHKIKGRNPGLVLTVQNILRESGNG